MEVILPFLREFGFPVALCITLLLAIRQQNMSLVKAYTDRISVLEKLVKVNTDKIEELESDRLRRSDEYGHTLKDMAIRYGQTIRDHDNLMREVMAVLRRLVDSIAIRPCMADDLYTPHPKPHPTPTSRDLPKDPTKETTARFHNGG